MFLFLFSAKKPAFFDLDEIDSHDVKATVVTSPSSSRMTSPPPSVPKSKVPASSKKRKTATTSAPAQEASPFEGLNFDDTLGKISQFTLQV